MNVILTKKAKCQGCKALVSNGNSYECSLKFAIDFNVVNDVAISPKPVDKCYKPKSKKEYEKAKELLDR